MAWGVHGVRTYNGITALEREAEGYPEARGERAGWHEGLGPDGVTRHACCHLFVFVLSSQTYSLVAIHRRRSYKMKVLSA